MKDLFGRLVKSTFLLWQNLGIHITLNHFYEPIPDTRTLKEDLWQTNSDLVGINMNDHKQQELLNVFASHYKSEYDLLPKGRTSTPYEYYSLNDAYGSVDGEILYCMVRHFKPKKIFEIGSGNSTYLSAKAVLVNRERYSLDCELVSYEPYPNDVLKKGFPGLSKLNHIKVQDIPLSEFKKLQENDILFIDSTHVLRVGSDVQYEFLEILPRLNKGVIIHIHDIFLPAEYPKEWILKEFRFWNEQYILQAFLTFNDSFEVLWGGSYMHLKYPEKLKASFKSYESEKHRPGSFWIRKTG